MKYLPVALLIVCSYALKVRDYQVIASTDEIKEKSALKGIVVFEYASSQCSHCQKYTPPFKDNAEKSKVRFFTVWCDKTECTNVDLERYPTVVIYKDGVEIWRDVQPLIEEIEEKLEGLTKQ